MSDAVLQLLLVLAFLAIGLISVTFPIYAICATYLRQEKSETEIEQKQRIEKLKEEIDKLKKDLSGEPKDSKTFREIEDRIRLHKIERRNLELRVNYLTVRGAVGRPVVDLVLAIFTAGLGVFFFNYDNSAGVITLGLASAILSGLALYSLYHTLLAVEIAVLRPARTVVFTVAYSTKLTTKEIKLGKETAISIGAQPKEDIENLIIGVYVPPEIQVTSHVGLSSDLQPEGFKYPYYNMLQTQRPFAPKNTFYAMEFRVLSNKIGTYRIPVRVYAKGIYEYETELTLNIVE